MVLSELEKKVNDLTKKIAKLEKQNKDLHERVLALESADRQDKEMPLTPQGRIDLWTASQR